MTRRDPVLVIGCGVTLVLLAFASGYGYHRDELYFLAAGRHLAPAYADQGVFTPLLARAMTALVDGSLTVLRVPAAIAAGLTVVLTGRIARELGDRPRAATIAAACAAVATIVLFTGHLLSTSTFDLLVWTTLTWLAVRAVRTGDRRLWLCAGAVLGVGLLNKPLPVFLAAGLLGGIAVGGPRRLLRDPYLWGGAAVALVLWAPWLVWQAGHGWPQLDVSRSIASGASASSQPWWALLPFQFLLVSPVLAPVWIIGLVRLFRDDDVRRFRFLAVAWALLAVVFMATGGKPYYLAGMLPLLLGSGAVVVDRWLKEAPRWCYGALVAAVALSAVVDAVISLPVLPASRAGAVVAVNPDVGETIGWPRLVATVAAVARELPAGRPPVILTRNYGEAGAIDRYGPALGLPRAYSGHNAYGDWGSPADDAAPVIAVGFGDAALNRSFRDCRLAARVDYGLGIDNDEQGTRVSVRGGPEKPWSQLWPEIPHLG